MHSRKNEPAHGSLGIAYYPDYTLMKFSGAWNASCAEIFDMLVNKRIESVPDNRRCTIGDGRNWGFATPESQKIITETSIRSAEFYKELYIAYLVEKSQMGLFKHLFDTVKEVAHISSRWQYFTELPNALDWLREHDFSLPDLTDDDFPEARPAREYLKTGQE